METRRRFLGQGLAVAATGLLAGCRADAPAPSGPSTPTQSAPPPSAARAAERFRYGPHPNQWADLHLPSGGGPFPVVMTIHGGGWQVGTDARETAPYAGDLVRAGIAVWNVEYRLLDAGGGWPATFADVAAATDLLPTASKGRLDLSAVIAFGASAGGHLAAWAASRHRVPVQQRAAVGGPPRQRVHGVVAYAAPLDLVLDSDNTGASVHLMDGTPARHPDRYAAGSPYALLPTGVPTVCLHGDADQVIPFAHSERYVEKAVKLRSPAELVRLPGVDHPNSQPLRVDEPLWNQTMAKIQSLLGR